jgi:MoxR-like ATPase
VTFARWLKCELASLAFIARAEYVLFLGPSGVGKTHLVIALSYLCGTVCSLWSWGRLPESAPV